MSPDQNSTEAVPAGASTDPLAECAAAVRRHDPDRYFAALFAPPEARTALIALYAFNLEIARIRETVSEPMIGQIRLQWWRDALAGIFGDAPVRRHAVALALADAIRRHALPRAELERAVDAREFDLEDRQPETLDALAAYSEASSGAFGVLAAAALGARDGAARIAAREAGVAWALAGLIRAIPFHAAQRRCYLPRDLLADDDALDALYGGDAGAAAKDAIAAVAERARTHLAAARTAARGLPRSALPAVLPATLIDSDLRRLARAGFDVFSLRPSVPLRRQVRLVRAALLGRI